MDTVRSPLGPGTNYESFGNLPQKQFSTSDSRLIREELGGEEAINVYAIGMDNVAVVYRKFNGDGGYTCYRWLLNTDGSTAGFCHTLRSGEESQVEVSDVLKRVGLQRIKEELSRIWGISLNVQGAITGALSETFSRIHVPNE